MRLSRDDLFKITHFKIPRYQAAWFRDHLGAEVPFDRDGPILSLSTYEALLAKRLGVGPAPFEPAPERRPSVHLPGPKTKRPAGET